MNPKGFSLLECLLAVSILAVLTLSALPMHNSSWHKSQRALARTALAQAGWKLEREALWRGSYQASAPNWTDLSEGLSYRLTFSLEPDGYVLRAVPVGRQSADACGILWLNQSGQRGADGGLAACW